MTNRTVSTRLSRSFVLVAIVFAALGAMPVRAASSVDIEARALVGGRYAAGGWAAISVTLVNEGDPTQGQLIAESVNGTVRRFVELPAGSRKVVPLYVRPEAFQLQVAVRYEEPNGTVTATTDVRVFEQAAAQSAIVGDRNGHLRPQLRIGVDEFGAAEPTVFGPADIPDRPEPLDGLSSIVWAGDSTALGEAQRRTLERWVADGGQLVVIGGPDWQTMTAGFADLLPLESPSAIDGVPLEALAAWAGSDVPPVETTTVTGGVLRDGARAIVSTDDGVPLLTMRRLGAGRVIMSGVDLATEPFRTWDGAVPLWSRLLPSSLLLENAFGGFPPAEERQNTVTQALDDLPQLEVPPAELLLGVIVGYIMLIGPVSYLVLRRVDRRELAWVTAPILVVLFSACSYGIGRTLKGSDVVVNQIALVRSSSAGGSATVETYAGLFSPERGAFDLSVEADALVSRVLAPEFVAAEATLVEQGDPATLRDLRIGSAGFEIVRADAVVAYEPSLDVVWHRAGTEVIATVTNTGDEPIEDVAFVSTGGGEMLGDLDPGQTAELALEPNLNGTSASDQVYGFSGFDSTDPEQREIAMRRQVIDALVGYGARLPVEVDAGFVGDRGPFMIGWRGAEGPLPVAVDGHEARRFAQSVEVISTRPSLGPGPTTLAPAHFSVAVTSTEGDAFRGGDGLMYLGEGSITYSIALPLEAANMRVDELEILIGPDVSIVMGDPGGFGGFLPEGTTLEYRDIMTGEWSLLNDSIADNQFEIPEPERAVSDAGRIEVRLTSTMVDEGVGPAGVFLTAQGSGVIDQ